MYVVFTTTKVTDDLSVGIVCVSVTSVLTKNFGHGFGEFGYDCTEVFNFYVQVGGTWVIA